MTKRTLWVAALLAMLLAMFCGARADSPLGVQKGARYTDIELSESSDAATVLDYLKSYLASEVSSRLTQAKILSKLTDDIEKNMEHLASVNDDQIQDWLNVYNAQPENGLLSARELAEGSYRKLVDTRNEVDFFATKLTEMLNQDAALRDLILCGSYT